MMKLSTDKMLAEVKNGVGWMTFNHPERRNALKMEMTAAIPEILEGFAADDAVRVLVMKGAGDRAFVSGADISGIQGMCGSGNVMMHFEVKAELAF